MFLTMRQREHEASKEEEQMFGAVDSVEALTEAVNSPLESMQDVHDPSRPILFREFVEAIVRIAVTKYGNSTALPTPAEQLEHTLEWIGNKPMVESKDIDDVEDFRDVFNERQGVLRQIFES